MSCGLVGKEEKTLPSCSILLLHLAPKFSSLNEVREVVTSGLRMRIKIPLKKNFVTPQMAELGDLTASLLSDFAEDPLQL